VYRLYQHPGSGNCYKIQLLLELLGLPYETVNVNILAGESRTPAFLAHNPVGKVPVLQIGSDDFLPESNAALWYLAEGSRFLPADRRGRAEVVRWLSFEQYSHEPNVATARFWIHFLGNPPQYAERLQEKQEAGRHALRIMDDHLARADYFVGGGYSIVDIALYAYTHVADEADIELAPYPAILAWLARVGGEPGHVAMEY
jgi:glutathione S-transferase